MTAGADLAAMYLAETMQSLQAIARGLKVYK
jgi:hypothetical protein